MNRAHDENFSFSPASGSVCGSVLRPYSPLEDDTLTDLLRGRDPQTVALYSKYQYSQIHLSLKLSLLSSPNTASPTNEAIARSLEMGEVRKGVGSHTPCRTENVSRNVLPASLGNKQCLG